MLVRDLSRWQTNDKIGRFYRSSVSGFTRTDGKQKGAFSSVYLLLFSGAKKTKCKLNWNQCYLTSFNWKRLYVHYVHLWHLYILSSGRRCGGWRVYQRRRAATPNSPDTFCFGRYWIRPSCHWMVSNQLPGTGHRSSVGSYRRQCFLSADNNRLQLLRTSWRSSPKRLLLLFLYPR